MESETSRRGVGIPRCGRFRHTWCRAVPGLLLALAAAALVACGDSGSEGGTATSGKRLDADRVVYADYGGNTRAARDGAYFGPFERETGVPVVSADADPAKIPLFAEQGKAEWDIMDTDAWDVARFGSRGLLARLPPDIERSDLVPVEYRDYASAVYFGAAGLTFNSEKVRPQSWADFFDTEKFPGKRTLPPYPSPTVILEALMADGVACEDLYPVDLDRAFAKLDELKDDVLIYDSFGQAQQFLLQGSAVMAELPNGRVQPIIDQGLPLGFIWEDALLIWSISAVPVDAPHKEAAFELIRVQNQPEHQAEFSRLTKYGTTGTASLELIDEETRAKLPNAPENLRVQCPVDAAGLAKVMDEIGERYTKWLASL